MSEQARSCFISFGSSEQLESELRAFADGGDRSRFTPAAQPGSSKAGHGLQIGPRGLGIPIEIFLEAARLFGESGAETLVSLDEAGEETGEFVLYRDAFLRRHGPGLDPERSGCFPFVVKQERIPAARSHHAEEAESYRDRIGDRILNPERVDPEMRHLIEDDLQRVERVLSLPFGKKVLDVGCSDGTVTLMAAERWGCDEVVGVDVAGSAVEEARANARKRGLEQSARFSVSFIEDLDYPDGVFDTVCATETLEHVAPGCFNACLENLVRMLKPTGNIIVTVPNRYPDSSYIEQKRDRWRWPAHHHFFSSLSLSYVLGKYFSNIELFPHDDINPAAKGIYLICCCWKKK